MGVTYLSNTSNPIYGLLYNTICKTTNSALTWTIAPYNSNYAWLGILINSATAPSFNQQTSTSTLTNTVSTVGVNGVATGASDGTGGAITNAVSNGGPNLIRITSANHGLITGNKVAIVSVGGTTEANGTWTVTKIDGNTYDLQGSTFTNAYTSGGKWWQTGVWFNFFVIWNGSTLSTLSDVLQVPTLPSGYTHWALAGQALVQASTTAAWTFDTTAYERNVYSVKQDVFKQFTCTTAAVLQTVSLTNYVPPIASVVRGLIGIETGNNQTHSYVVASDIGTGIAITNVQSVQSVCASAIGPSVSAGTPNAWSGGVDISGYQACDSWEVLITTAQQVAWTCAANNSNSRMSVTGWRF